MYRCRIGTFYQKLRKSSKADSINRIDKKGPKNFIHPCQKIPKYLQTLLRIILVLCLVFSADSQGQSVQFPQVHGHTGQHHGHRQHLSEKEQSQNSNRKDKNREDQMSNFYARYTYGNKTRQNGIKNLHLNIRSLSNKVIEIKKIVAEQNPHILGLSECEMRKINGQFDEKKLKVPGYNLLFPKSWNSHGFARVLVYIKKTLQYQQVTDLEDELTQSIWVKGCLRNSKGILFCHFYREHTSSLGSSISQQKRNLEVFLFQWEKAAAHNNPSDNQEIHVSGDMNLDALNNKWLRPEYHLLSLSRLVQTACHLGNFHQLVTVPTRFQFNRVRGVTDISCIDHVYTNAKHRCSPISVIPFGGSDHDCIGYTRYSKLPPARTIRKKTYNNFVENDFIDDMKKVDWSDVYQCQDVHLAAEIFSRKFAEVLNHHAPWVIYQERKNYAPWLTDQTKELMIKRDNHKKKAEEFASAGDDTNASEYWSLFKQLRNKVNNKKKAEERNYKLGKIISSKDNPAALWATAKNFMNWQETGGHQLSFTLEVG